MFNPQSKEYVGSRAFIQESIDTAKVRQRTVAVQMEAGTEIERDGVLWRFKGGDRANPKNYERLGTVGQFSKGTIK